MKEKIKKIKYLLIALLLLITVFTPMTTKADSGFDAGYSSSDSWSDSGDSSSGEFTIETFKILFVTLFFSLGLPLYIRFSYNRFLRNKYKPYEGKIDNKEKILDEAYNVFIDVQNAWMNFDYPKLKELLSDELYNTYKMQLEKLNNKNHKNIMEEFRLNSIFIYSIKEDNLDKKSKEIEIVLDVSFYDYIVNKNNRLLVGSRINKINMLYKLTYKGTISNKSSIIKCPNCCADLDTNKSCICDYCKSEITVESNKLILINKQKLKQY